MRKAFDRQRRLDCPSVTKVPLNLNCRNETVPILRGLQHIYSRPQVRDPILRTIAKINQAIIQEGHRLEPKAAETVRGDSLVAGTNIHYPTDSSLIGDGLRKVLGIVVMLAGVFGLDGWRQHKHLYRKARRLVRKIERIAARKGEDYQGRIKKPYRELLELAEMVFARAESLRETVRKNGTGDAEALAWDQELETFLKRTRQVCGTARRRVLGGETIPNCEKLFSIFEPHTQLYKRGKAGQPIQFGRLVLVYEDGAGFITHYDILPRDKSDRDVVVQQTRKAQKRHKGRIRRASFDRGFHSPENQEKLAKIIKHPCLPMSGANQAEKAGEDGERRVPRGAAVAPGNRIGDRRARVGQRAGALPRPDGAGICTLYRSGRVGPESSRAGQALDRSGSLSLFFNRLTIRGVLQTGP